jgi:23S rRNA maturation-related 3'-5' exoribonuclease YhaM
MLINVARHVKSYHGKVTGAEPKNQMLRYFYFTALIDNMVKALYVVKGNLVNPDEV